MNRKNRIRIEIIEDKIKDIIESINLVEDSLPDNFEDFLSSRIIRDGIYKNIEFSIESVIDICNIINSDLDLGTPETEDSIIDNLDKNRVFNKRVVDLIREMKSFRNILVHKYGEINDKQAFETIGEGLKDFELIIKEIKEFLKKVGEVKGFADTTLD